MQAMVESLKHQFEGGTRQATGIPSTDVKCVFGCVADARGTFVEQAARLLLSLRWFGGKMADSPFVLAIVGGLSPEQSKFFERHGAQVAHVEVFDERHGPSNKLRFFELDLLDSYDHAVLLDCDTIVVKGPSDWVRCEGFAAKPADLPSVTADALSKYLAYGDIAVPDMEYHHDVADVPGLPYFNSGAIVLSTGWREKFIDAWKHYDRELIECAGEFDIPPIHVDQASLTAALLAEGIPISVLPSAMNFPAHLDPATYTQALYEIDPIVIHYHWLVDRSGYIEPLPFPRAGLRARMFNARLRAERGGLMTQKPASRKGRPKVVVGTGWWSSDESCDWHLGAPITRSVAFFDTWYRQVMNCIGPDRIVITDSNSPIKPDWRSYPGVHWIELDRNYGHPNDLRTGRIKTKFSGYTRSVINGAVHAYCCDADYYVYVEQDCLVRGEGFLEMAIGDATADILLGARTEGGVGIEGKPAAPMFQNSLIIVSSVGLERFITGIIGAPQGDGELSIEVIMERQCAPFGEIAIPYGRSRPIDFETTCFYAQHMTDEELEHFLDTEGIPLLGAVSGDGIFDV